MTVPSELLAAVPAACWRALLAHFAPWQRVPAKAAASSLGPALDEALVDSRSSAPLARALDLLSLLATPTGREALLDAAIDVGTDITTWPHEEGPPALAARLLVASITDATARATLDRAELHVLHHEDDEAPVSYVFRARRPMPPRTAIAAATATLTQQVDAWCRRYGRVAGSSVVLAGDRRSFSVERTHRFVTPVVRDASGEPTTLGHFPITTDHVALLEGDAWLVVTTSTPRMIGLYRRAAGAALFEDEAHFTQEPALSLDVLGALAAAGAREVRVPSLAAEVREVRLLGLRWDSGDRHELSVHGHDVLEAVQAEALRLQGRHVAMARLRVVTSDGRRLSMTAWPPHRARLPRGDAALGLRVLSAIGAMGTATRPRDLWDVATGLRQADELGAVLGALASPEHALLASEQSRGAVHPAHPHEGRALIAYPLPDAARRSFYGVSSNPTLPSRSLDPAELTMVRLDLGRLGEALAKRAGLTGAVRVHAAVGLLELGATSEAPPRVRVLLLTRDPAGDPARVGQRLRELVGAEPAIVLVPAGRTAELGVPVLALPDRLDAVGPLGPAIRAVLGGAAVVRPVEAAPPGTRLVIDAGSLRAWLDGVALTRLSERHVRLLLALARRPDGPVPAKELNESVTLSSDEGAARALKATLGELVLASFDAAGREDVPPAELIVRDGRRGYRLCVSAFVVG